jgi:hypothetical protein
MILLKEMKKSRQKIGSIVHLLDFPCFAFWSKRESSIYVFAFVG